MKRKRARRTARYASEAALREREAAAAAKLKEDATTRSHKIWRERCEAICAAAERERRVEREKYWPSMDAELRLRRVRPFDLSPHHGITQDILRRIEEIKLATLGYLEGTILTPDEGRCNMSEGPLGAVASQKDAVRLAAALTAEFPHIPFRIELMEEFLENVVWRGIDDIA